MMHDTQANSRRRSTSRTGSAASATDPRQDGAEQSRSSSATIPNVHKRFTRWAADEQGRQRRQGHGCGTRRPRVKQLGELNDTVTREGVDPGMPPGSRPTSTPLRGDPAAGAGDQRPRRREGLGGAVHGRSPGATTPTWRCTARTRRSAFRDVQAQPRKIISLADLERHRVREGLVQRRLHQRARTDPWRTLTGRQQFYHGPSVDDRFRRGLSSYRPPVDLKTTAGHPWRQAQRQPEMVLNFITPHQKWGIH